MKSVLLKNIRNSIRQVFSNIRLSKRPEKALLWLWLKRDMLFSRGMQVGIDAACGMMTNRKYFHTRKYIGVDADKQRLDIGMAKHPESVAVHSKIEDIVDLRGDFLVCVQCININKHFNTRNTLSIIQSFVNIINPGGYLIFNVGSVDGDLRKIEPNIDAILKGHFEKIIKIKYGAFSHQTNKFVSLIIAYLMFYVPTLRTINGAKKSYYFCQGRK